MASRDKEAAIEPFDPVPRVILFDLDDTICDYSSARDARLRHAFSLHQQSKPATLSSLDLDEMVTESVRMHPHGSDHFSDLFSRFGIVTSDLAEQAARWYRSNRFHGLELFPEALNVLRAVRATPDPNVRHRPIGIITNGPAEVQRAKIDLLGIGGLVDFVVISEAFGAAKPDVRIFEDALIRSGASAQDAVFVGDSVEHDMAGALAAGIPSIWINAHGAAFPSVGMAPDREVRGIGEVPALVGGTSQYSANS